MTRRTAWIALFSVLLVVLAVVVGVALRMRGEISKALGGAVASAVDEVTVQGLREAFTPEPHLDLAATLDGNVTTLAVTVENTWDHPYVDVVLSAVKLDGREPTEPSGLPLRIQSLAPGDKRRIELKFEGLDWIDDKVEADRIDLGWANKPLDFSVSYRTIRGAGDFPKREGVEVKGLTSEVTGTTTGVLVGLDEQQAKALKRKRDEARKALQ